MVYSPHDLSMNFAEDMNELERMLRMKEQDWRPFSVAFLADGC